MLIGKLCLSLAFLPNFKHKIDVYLIGFLFVLLTFICKRFTIWMKDAINGGAHLD